jgi:hypothetical protein
MIDLSEVLISLRPSNDWIITENILTWEDDISLKPTEIEIEAKRVELQNALPMKILREKRNIKLNDTDKYTSIPDWPHTTVEIKQSWLDYREALRNLPSNSSPQLDDNGELTNVNWPIPPS